MATDGSHVSQNVAIEMATRDELALFSFRAPELTLSSESDVSLEDGYTGPGELVLRRCYSDLMTPDLVGGRELASRRFTGNSAASCHGVATQLVLRCIDDDLQDLGDWMMVLSGANREACEVACPHGSACSSSPLWYDLCSDEDQLGPLPAGWEVNKTFIPVLPHVGHHNTSLLDEFWWDYETSASECKDDEMQEVIEVSLASTQEEAQWCNIAANGGDMSVMVVIVEVQEKPVHIKPEGLDGCFTCQQKAKTVPWTSEQCKFLRSYAHGDSAPLLPLPNATLRADAAVAPE